AIAHELCRKNRKYGIGFMQNRFCIGTGADTFRKIDIAQITRIAALVIQCFYGFAVARVEPSFVAACRSHCCKRGSPGSAAHHGNFGRFRHAFAPLRPVPNLGADFASSGQRERGAMASESAAVDAARSAPAQAIMAALSVQSSCGGAMKLKPCVLQSVSNASRSVLLAATPPATINAGD